MFHDAVPYRIPCVASYRNTVQEKGGAEQAFYGTAPRASLKTFAVRPSQLDARARRLHSSACDVIGTGLLWPDGWALRCRG